MNRAARTNNPLEVELAFGRVAVEMSAEQLEETLVLAVERHAPSDALGVQVMARLGEGTVRELAADLLAGDTARQPDLPDSVRRWNFTDWPDEEPLGNV